MSATTDPDDARGQIILELGALLESRRRDPPTGSYSATLLGDPERSGRKIMEEAYELCLELMRREPDTERVASEAADLVFHVLAGVVGAGVSVDAVLGELEGRRSARRQGNGTADE